MGPQEEEAMTACAQLASFNKSNWGQSRKEKPPVEWQKNNKTPK